MAKSKKPSASTLNDEWVQDKEWIDGFTEDFQDLDNLADAVALSRTKGAPMVGDVTLASVVRQIPRASIQQVPVFNVEVNGTKLSFPAIISDYIVRRVIFNEDTFGKGILSTMQIGAESALTHGFQPFLATIGNVMSDFGTTMKLIHYNDVAIERGVFDASESYRDKVRTRVTRSRLKKLYKQVKANPDSEWDASAIKELLEKGPSNDAEANNKQSEPRYKIKQVNDPNTFDIITDYTNEPFGEITTFAPGIDRPLRVIKSKSKFGYPRLTFLVIDPAQLTPFGISRVRLASPAANYANIYLQSTAKMQLLNADPPVLQRGQFTTPIRMKRGALWQTLDPNSDAKLQELSNSTLQQFENVLNFIDNQIYSIMGATPGSVGQSNRGGAYQNTVSSNMEKNVTDLSNNQITNILENFLRQYALTALDLFVSEQVGETELIIDDKAKDAINRLAENEWNEAPDIDPATMQPKAPFVKPVGKDNTVKIDWKEFYDNVKSWTVGIDLSMSKDTLEEKQRADAQDMLTVMKQTANPNDPTAMNRANQVEDMLIEKTFPEIQRRNPEMQMQPPLDPAAEVNTPV